MNSHAHYGPRPTLAIAAVRVAQVGEEAWNAFQQWLKAGKQAGMAYMERHAEIRRNPALLTEPGARTMLCLALPFDPHPARKGNGTIASYALGEDYHDAIRRRLKPSLKSLKERFGGAWRICIDSAPLMERYWAVRAGLAQRTNSAMVNVPGMGTACFLAEILTDRTLEELGAEEGPLTQEECDRLLGPGWNVLEREREASRSLNGSTGQSACNGCNACRLRCPGRALACDSGLDARRCISYLTIEHRGDWTEPEAQATMQTEAGRDTIFGCDRCVAGCRLNLARLRAGLVCLPEFAPREAFLSLSREECASMDDIRFAELFARSPIKRTGAEGLRRNCKP